VTCQPFPTIASLASKIFYYPFAGSTQRVILAFAGCLDEGIFELGRYVTRIDDVLKTLQWKTR
jgi:hypothetical protein